MTVEALALFLCALVFVGIGVGYVWGRLSERARIVAWLWDQPATTARPHGWQIAQALDRGDHRAWFPDDRIAVRKATMKNEGVMTIEGEFPPHIDAVEVNGVRFLREPTRSGDRPGAPVPHVVGSAVDRTIPIDRSRLGDR